MTRTATAPKNSKAKDPAAAAKRAARRVRAAVAQLDAALTAADNAGLSVTLSINGEGVGVATSSISIDEIKGEIHL